MNKKGFFLLEVILIILLVTAFLIIIPPVKKTSCDFYVNQLKDQLEIDLIYASSYTLHRFTLVNIYFIPDENYYFLRDGKLKHIYKRYYNHNLCLDKAEIRVTHGFVVNNYLLNIKCLENNYQILITEKSGNIYVIKK